MITASEVGAIAAITLGVAFGGGESLQPPWATIESANPIVAKGWRFMFA